MGWISRQWGGQKTVWTIRPREWWSVALFRGAPWQDQRQWAWNTGGSLWTSGNTFSLWGWLSTGTGCPERCVESLLLGYIQNPSGHGPGQPPLGGPLKQGGGWTSWPPEAPSNLSLSEIVWTTASEIYPQNGASSLFKPSSQRRCCCLQAMNYCVFLKHIYWQSYFLHCIYY